jgi:hypothetical protein
VCHYAIRAAWLWVTEGSPTKRPMSIQSHCRHSRMLELAPRAGRIITIASSRTTVKPEDLAKQGQQGEGAGVTYLVTAYEYVCY